MMKFIKKHFKPPSPENLLSDTVMCVCELPSHHTKELSSAKLDNVLRICDRLAANPVVSKYNIDFAHRRVTTIADPIGVVYEWTIPTLIKMEVIDYTRKIWKELMSDIDIPIAKDSK